MLEQEDFDITSPPKQGHEDVGPWANMIFDMSRAWRDDELKLSDIWRANYKLFRGNHWGENKKRNDVTINLFFSNIVRTVANVTARHPVAEVIDLDGSGGDLAKIATARVKKWWLDTNQRTKLRATTLNSEIYGITWEKSIWSGRFKEPGIVIVDPFAVFPYPGNWEDVAKDCPALCHATAIDPKVVQNMYNIKEEIEIDETFTLLGGEREEVSGTSSYGTTRTSVGLQGHIRSIRSQSMGNKGEKALVVELWCRDYSKDKEGELIYPGGIRVITFCNGGKLVLSDVANPGINTELAIPQVETNYLYNRFPLWKSNSYQDTTSLFGFSAAEQTADLNIKIDELVSRLVNFAMRSMTGIMVIPPGSGITKRHLNTNPNLVLFPDTHDAATGIKIIPFPNPPAIVGQVIDMLTSMHDRVHAIQDADRGESPAGITAASAIVALQERNAVLIQHKIDGIDRLVTERGNYSIAQWQMHGHGIETINADDETYQFVGVKMAGKSFNYTVESGSSMPKTSLQIQEQAQALFEKGGIDQQALLETLNFPKWREIVERMGEKQLDQAMQILVQSGLPKDQAIQLMEVLMQPQGGPGDNQPQIEQAPQPGVPRSYQGEIE